MIKQETCTVKHVARPPAGACRGNVQPPAGRAHTAGIRYGRRPAALARTHAGIRYGRRLAALTRDKVPPQAGRTCEQSMRRPAALARTHAGIRYGRRLAALARPHAGAMYSRRPAALTLPHGGRPEAGIRCGRSSYPASIPGGCGWNQLFDLLLSRILTVCAQQELHLRQEDAYSDGIK